MNIDLKDPKLKYALQEKHRYVVIKSLEHFKPIIGVNLVKIHIPFIQMKDVLTQAKPSGRLAR